jgi:hypothetical protein
MAAAANIVHDIASVNAKFDIFGPKVVRVGFNKLSVTYKPIATIDQSDLEFTIPADSDFYINPKIHIILSGQLLSADGKTLESTDRTNVPINLLHSLFSQ